MDKKKKMGSGNQPGGQQKAPGRDIDDDLSKGHRPSGGVKGSERPGDFDREDREREQPGSKQWQDNR